MFLILAVILSGLLGYLGSVLFGIWGMLLTVPLAFALGILGAQAQIAHDDHISLDRRRNR